jgi:hypothetical protein
MNSSNNQDWEKKLKELEAEINQTSTSTSEKQTEPVKPHVEIANAEQITNWLNSARDWFNNLPSVGRVAVGVGGALVGISVLSTFIKLVSSLVSVAIVGGLIYVAYKFFIGSAQEK